MKPLLTKIAKGLSIFVLLLSALCYYSNMVYHSASNKNAGFFTQQLIDFATYPDHIKEVLTSNELAGVPATYVKKDSSFLPSNKLSYDLFAVNSFWNIETYSWDIKLFNLKNDEVLYKWNLPENLLLFNTTDFVFANAAPRNCIVFSDKSILVSADESANLMRLDAQSKPIWIDRSLIYHHSLNLDADSNIWACTSDLNLDKKYHLKGIKNFDGTVYKYKENYITQIDKNTGKILFHKAIGQILKDNHYSNFLVGFSDPMLDNDPTGENMHDPIHLNDIEPILQDGKYWKKGDLLISCRHRSFVMLYRPSSNKIIRLIYGDFITQHDVDVVSDSEISIFNNKFIRFRGNTANDTCQITDSVRSSEIVIYNFKDSTSRTYLNKYMVEGAVWTQTQGLLQKLTNGDLFVESQNKGQLYIINDSGFVMKKTLPSPMEGYNYLTHWIRLYEKLPY